MTDFCLFSFKKVRFLHNNDTFLQCDSRREVNISTWPIDAGGKYSVIGVQNVFNATLNRKHSIGPVP